MADRQNKKEFTPIYRFGRLVGRFIMRVLCPSRITGRKIIKSMKAPYMLIANHQSALDPLVVGALCPYEVRFLGKQELTGSRFTRWLLGQLHMISIARHESDLEAMRKAAKVLREGHVLGIFPEGTRHLPEMMATVESGAAFLAIRHQVPLVPVYIHGKLRPFHTNRIRIGAPIMPDSFPEGGLNKENADLLSGQIRDLFYELRRQEEEKK